MRESLRRRLKLPSLHPPSPPPPSPPPSPPPPPPPPPKSHHHHHHHHPNDDELEEGEFKDVDPLDQINIKDERDHEHERIVQSSSVKDIETTEGEGEPECPVEKQEIAHLEQQQQEEESRRESEPVVEDNVVDVVAVRDESGNEGVLVSESGESERRDEVGEEQDKNTINAMEGDGTPGTPVEEREITAEQQGGGEGDVENEAVIEVEEERGQPELLDNQDEATVLHDEGKIDGEGVEEQVGQLDLAMEVEMEIANEKDDGVDDEDGPPPGWESGPPVKPLPPLPPPPPPPPPEKGQLVCGSCRRLLSYPRGFKHVQCSCCQTVNYVLEEHQIGQVQCGNCLLLLMYPYEAHSVRCSSCRFVTDIRDHNKRPRLSEQQSRACRPFCVPL